MLPASNLAAWVRVVTETLSQQQRDVFLMLLWAIWSERNRVLWKGGTFNPLNTACGASKLLSDHQQVHKATVLKQKRPMTRWQHPPSGRLKLNIDGSFHADSGRGGIGAVIRDENAMRAGLLLAIHQGMINIDIETNCAMVVTAVNGDMKDLSEIGCIVEDCKAYLSSILSTRVQSIYREVNSIAHRLAHLTSLSYLDEYWLEEALVIIQNALYEDSCTTT
ncbi:uncharacterized protein LOC121052282 [Rosa chinensis]|uniref:uncharacterized protein LOC121052282 n=1 Tax=Rosa chinensis TaxID=74649 RepID=UPI001AD943CF|nr:uncharacterized protein LOC121052282 [Rosa chinensis]